MAYGKRRYRGKRVFPRKRQLGSIAGGFARAVQAVDAAADLYNKARKFSAGSSMSGVLPITPPQSGRKRRLSTGSIPATRRHSVSSLGSDGSFAGSRRYRKWKKPKKGKKWKIIGFGKYKGPFATKLKSVSQRWGAIHGIVNKQEYGGVNKDDQCIYVGHGMADFQLNNAFGLSLVKFIFAAVGVHMANTNQLCPWYGKIVITRFDKTGDNKQLVTLTTLFNTTITFKTIATDMVGSGSADQLFHSSHVDQEVEWYELELYKLDDGSVPKYNLLKSWCLKGMMCHVYWNSVLNLQNVTQSGTKSGAPDQAGISDDAAGIWANPIKGRVYQSVGTWDNCLTWNQRTPSYNNGSISANSNVFRADRTSGIISTNYTGLKLAVPYDNKFKKPPMGFEFSNKCVVANVHIDPGDIKQHKMRWTGAFTFSTYHNKQRQNLDATANVNEHMKFGNVAMFALEKSIDMRTSATDRIQVGYELNQTIQCAWTYKKARTTETEYYIQGTWK